MRCSICDYSNDAPSHYHSGLMATHWNRMQVKFDRRRGDYVCDACSSVSNDALSEMINIDEEYVFNALEPKVKKRFELDKNSR